MNVSSVINKISELNLGVRVDGGKLYISPSSAIPNELVPAIQENKRDLLQHYELLRAQAQEAIAAERQEAWVALEDFRAWSQREWKTVNRPEWHDIMVKALETGDDRRAKFAWWMLTEVLQDG